jgi:nitrate/nitrite-specific signal transduction histidine kinase
MTNHTRRTVLSHLAALMAMPSLTAFSALAQTKAAPVSNKISLASALNKAGRLRMLSQRTAKLYAQLGLGILPEKAFQQLKESGNLFDAHLSELLALAASPENVKTYNELSGVWATYRETLNLAPSIDSGSKVLEQSERVLRLAQRGVVEIEAVAGGPAGKLINICGRQRMLSQRMAKSFFMREWGVSKLADTETAAARSEFKTGLTLLRSDANTPADIKAQLGLAETQWLFFENAFDAAPKTAAATTATKNIATTSERILEQFDQITAMYERMGV